MDAMKVSMWPRRGNVGFIMSSARANRDVDVDRACNVELEIDSTVVLSRGWKVSA